MISSSLSSLFWKAPAVCTIKRLQERGGERRIAFCGRVRRLWKARAGTATPPEKAHTRQVYAVVPSQGVNDGASWYRPPTPQRSRNSQIML